MHCPPHFPPHALHNLLSGFSAQNSSPLQPLVQPKHEAVNALQHAVPGGAPLHFFVFLLNLLSGLLFSAQNSLAVQPALQLTHSAVGSLQQTVPGDLPLHFVFLHVGLLIPQVLPSSWQKPAISPSLMHYPPHFPPHALHNLLSGFSAQNSSAVQPLKQLTHSFGLLAARSSRWSTIALCFRLLFAYFV